MLMITTKRLTIEVLTLCLLKMSVAECSGNAIMYYERSLPNGHIVTVEKCVRQDLKNIGATTPTNLPMGWIAVSCEKEINIYRFFMQENEGEKELLWEMEVMSPTIPSGFNVDSALTVNDLVENQNHVAFLITSRSTELVVVEKDDLGHFNTKIRKELFTRNALAALRRGQLAWHDTLYVLLEINPDGPRVWRVNNGDIVPIFGNTSTSNSMDRHND